MASTSRDRDPSSLLLRSFRRSRRASDVTARKIARRAKLGVEFLEDRVVLTTFMVNTFNDTNAVVMSGPSAGTDANGDISLRSALEAINYYSVNSDVSDTIELSLSIAGASPK